MIGIGDRPILWHIMKIYSHYGFNDFIICLGYNIVKEFFAGYYTHTSDVTFDLKNNEMTVQRNTSEPWRVTLVDTGLNTMTGGRIKRVQEYIGNEPFMLTYGDGVADIDIDKLLKFHKKAMEKSILSPKSMLTSVSVCSTLQKTETSAHSAKSKLPIRAL